MKRLFAIAALAASAGTACAAPVYDTFGPLASATFGGSGIPNDAVAIDNFSGGTLFGSFSGTLGLTAFGRFGLSPVTNNGAGTFTAQTGQFDPPGPAANGALWNFGYYLNVTGPFAGFARLSYDFDPGAGTNFGTVTTPIVSVGSTTVQDSQNLLFSFLSVSNPFLGIAAPGVPFNPDAPGTYTIQLELFQTSLANPRGTRVGLASIDVNVVPEPSVAVLLLLGLGMLVAARRRAAGR